MTNDKDARIAALEAQNAGLLDQVLELENLRDALEAQLAERVKATRADLSALVSQTMRNHEHDPRDGGGPRMIGEGGAPRVDWYKLRNELVDALSTLEATPPAPKVTNAMVDAAERMMAAHYERPLKAWELTALHEAITAAQEAGK